MLEYTALGCAFKLQAGLKHVKDVTTEFFLLKIERNLRNLFRDTVHVIDAMDGR